MNRCASPDPVSEGPEGPWYPDGPIRRLLHRLLRPILLRQAALFGLLNGRVEACEPSLRGVRRDLDSLSRRQERVAGQFRAALAFGPEYRAMVRRLAMLEDRVAVLTGHSSPAPEDARDRRDDE